VIYMAKMGFGIDQAKNLSGLDLKLAMLYETLFGTLYGAVTGRRQVILKVTN